VKETIEAYMVVSDKMRFIFLDKGNAETEAQITGGTVVKLTGELPKKPKLLAPALINVCGSLGVSSTLYSSEEEAREELHDMVVAWPAVPNADGFYSVEAK
jgi:hypothetical protein